MPRRTDRHRADAAQDTQGTIAPDAGTLPGSDGTKRDLSAVPIAGLTPRRVASVVCALAAIWIVIAFARQAGAASEAASRAEELRLSNAQMAMDVGALERELQLIQRRSYIEVEMRRYGLGRSREIPFQLEPGAPPLSPDAPGSAVTRVGEDAPQVTPLESWLSVLFGPGR
jgi:hypothetical protein